MPGNHREIVSGSPTTDQTSSADRRIRTCRRTVPIKRTSPTKPPDAAGRCGSHCGGSHCGVAVIVSTRADGGSDYSAAFGLLADVADPRLVHVGRRAAVVTAPFAHR